jgi:DNA-binding CsgD family transcriptional regulator
LTLLADDLSIIEIASSLNITINTVRKHLSQIYQSLRVKDRSEAVAKFRAEILAPGGAIPTLSPPSSPTNSTSLSQREREVLNLLAENRSRDDIACSLGITKGTLRGHISRIYNILDVHNWQDAVATIQPKYTVSTAVLARLSEREMDVMRLVSNDLSAKEIAVILCITQGTVYVYLSNIYRTIGVKTRAEAMALFRREAGTARAAERDGVLS